MKFVLIGAGQRGMIYARYAHEAGHEITAVAESDPVKREIAAKEFGIPEDKCFIFGEALLAEPRMGDAAIIATMDRDHYREAVPAMEKGYHLLLEKPISPVPEETLAIEETAVRTGRHVTVCHVLRYSPFFRELKKAVTSGKIGRVITIQHNENIGNFHFAHSFVRGNWRRSDEASPLIMQKSCHDMDCNKALLRLNIQDTLRNSRKKQVLQTFSLDYIDIVGTCLEDFLQCSDFIAVLVADRQTDQVCHIVLILFEGGSVPAFHQQGTAAQGFHVLDPVHALKTQDHKLFKKLHAADPENAFASLFLQDQLLQDLKAQGIICCRVDFHFSPKTVRSRDHTNLKTFSQFLSPFSCP